MADPILLTFKVPTELGDGILRESAALDDVSEEIKPYDPEGDCALYADRPTSWLHLVPGQVAVFFPEDAHAPVIGEGKIRKMIAKVKIA